MNYYTVSIIGSGSEIDPFRPNIPDNISFVGQLNGIDYLIATPHDLSGWSQATYHMPRVALETICNARGLIYENVIEWNVGGNY